MTWYGVRHCSDWDRVQFWVWNHKKHSISRPNGRAMGCIKDIEENGPRYNGTVLYISGLVRTSRWVTKSHLTIQLIIQLNNGSKMGICWLVDWLNYLLSTDCATFWSHSWQSVSQLPSVTEANTLLFIHSNDVTLNAMTSQITSLTIVYSTVYSGLDRRKYQSSASLALVRGIQRWPVKGQ